ncbi:HD domain-containing protein [Shewanella sp. AS1]|uniref:HD domain-containing protein n=1 Tax=Shewanella sp. AS1 TaxID=2907626 RepID=UPI001F32A809|nr:HD domain-containing protein [Shewanella sp. AS1]MCE9679711.1 HD domain-containing protein [Shewanella sp. AS1]
MDELALRGFESEFAAHLASRAPSDSAHDLQHIKRVVNTARELACQSGALLEVVVPAAWLHDYVALTKDHPQRSDSSRLAAEGACEYLQNIHYPAQYLDQIYHAILAHSFSAQVAAQTLEAKIVQDADRLDALGAIGIARCLQVGSSLGRALYCADDPFCRERQPDDSRFTLDHFYQKLLHLPETMQTQAGKEAAHRRRAVMMTFIEQLAIEIGEA